jgi:ATP-binding cassette, subfamily B, bacterial
MPADPIPSQWWPLIWRYLHPQWPKALLMTVLLLTSTGLQLLNPQIVSVFLDDATNHATVSHLVWLAIFFIISALANQGIAAWATYVSQDVAWTSGNALREDLMRHCLSLDTAFVSRHTPGVFISRIDGDLTKLATFFSDFVVRVLGSVLLLIGAIILLFQADWRLGLGMLGFAALTLVALQIARIPAVRAGVAERTAWADLFGFIEEHLAGVEDIRANGGGPYAMQQLTVKLRSNYFKSLRARMFRAVTWISALGAFAISYVLVFGVGGALYLRGIIPIGTVYLYFQYNEMLQTPLEYLSRQMQEFQEAASGIIRIAQLTAERPTILDGAHITSLPDTALTVAFNGVQFAYPDDGVQVLHDLSFQIPAGTTLGLLGRTGSGKTTMSRLLFRLYDLETGSVRLNDVDVRDMPLATLRRHVGLVTQDVQLFHATVRDNLTFFDATIPDERITQVIGQIGLGDWLARLPQGLDTQLDAGGAGLSAGESQLLAFIRVFLRDPGVVILDEPSSRLDPATEKQIEQGMRLLMRGRTGIIIAHRLGTVRMADEIMILGDGQMLEHGAYAALAANPASQFATLLRVGLEEALA